MPKDLKKGKPTTRRYSAEEKAQAVRLVRQLRTEPNVGNDPRSSRLNLHMTRAVTVHLGSAFFAGSCWLRTPAESHIRRPFPRTRPDQINEPREESGLGRADRLRRGSGSLVQMTR